MKFQFNKTELQRINKDLKVRLAALPTLKNKESALRAEIKKFKRILKEIKKELTSEQKRVEKLTKLFIEYEDVLSIEDVQITVQKIAGVKIPVFEKADFKIEPFSMFQKPGWFLDGIEMIKKMTELKLKFNVEQIRIKILEYARKKTTQKVNLYEKVQIPAFEEAVIKIKRFIEDEENLDRASQKIVKKKKVAVL